MEDKMNKIKYMNNSQKVRKERIEKKKKTNKRNKYQDNDLNRNVSVIVYESISKVFRPLEQEKRVQNIGG